MQSVKRLHQSLVYALLNCVCNKSHEKLTHKSFKLNFLQLTTLITKYNNRKNNLGANKHLQSLCICATNAIVNSVQQLIEKVIIKWLFGYGWSLIRDAHILDIKKSKFQVHVEKRFYVFLRSLARHLPVEKN